MAIFEHKFEIGFRDVGKSNKITNKGLLGYLEDTAGMHSNLVGYGLNDIEKTGLTWILLNWKVKIIKRPLYGESILVKTWARNTIKFYTFRDFEVYNDRNELIAIASSKWVLLDAKTMTLTKISNELIGKYNPENKAVFSNEKEIGKLTFPTQYESMLPYTIQRKDIDINKHVHNVSYLDFAYEVLPEKVYDNSILDTFEILYKKKADDEKTIHCVIRLDESN